MDIEMDVESEQFEFELSQYADGTLSPAQRAAVEDRLRVDPAARKLLAQYQQLNGLIRTGAGAAPQMQWERLSEHFCDHVANQVNKASFYSIGYRGLGLAIAAALLIAVGVLSLRMSNTAQTLPPVAVATASPEVLAVNSQEDTNNQAGAMEVAIAQPTEADVAREYSDGQGVVVEQPAVALVGYTKLKN